MNCYGQMLNKLKRIDIRRTVIQRVKNASVDIGGRRHSEIGSGLLVLLAIEDRDTEEDIDEQ